LNQFSIFCNSSAYGSNSSVTWIKSPNKINISVLQPDSRILITNNGQLVNFTTLYLPDEQYYACGVTLNNKLAIINQYYLFVRGKISQLIQIWQKFKSYHYLLLFYFLKVNPTMTLIFNNLPVDPNQTILLTKNSTIYTFFCASVISKPDVNLTLYDSNSLIPLSTPSNSFLENSCNGSLCTNILRVDFQFTDNSFDNMVSLTCAANSSNALVPLTATISRNVTVVLPRKFLNYCIFIVRIVD